MRPEKFIASAIISDLQGSDFYMIIRGKLCDVKANSNDVRVTEAFIDEIVKNKDKYICNPLCADLRGLINDRTIGHMYNKATGEFMSQIIGGFIDFEKEGTGENSSLIITAKVLKRYKHVCDALLRLFYEGRLKFSFEIACGEYTVDDDGIFTIDASPNNYFEGAAVVTFPACEDAVALELIAECLGKGDEKDMPDNEKNAQASAENENVSNENTQQNAENNENQQENQNASPEQTAENQGNSSEQQSNGEQQNAECHNDDDPDDHDNDDGDDDDEHLNACDNTHDPKQENASVDNGQQPKEQNAEQNTPSAKAENSENATVNMIAELRTMIETMAAELASLKESVSHQASQENQPEQHEVTAEEKWPLLNPFMSSMKLEGYDRFASLLEVDETTNNLYD